MAKKLVSFVQVNHQKGPRELNSYYLPYSVGCLWAYAVSHDEIKNKFELNNILWRREPVETAALRFANDSVVAFSCYVWNRNYNYNLAQAIKRINPNCLIVFGGPEVPVTDPKLFLKLPFADLAVVNEGERVFADILRHSDISDYSTIPGLVVNQNGQALITATPERIIDLEDLPSPYLTGLFDDLVAQHPEIAWTATLETNRGCPYACTFCDWGSLTYSKVKQFGLDKVYAELDWMSTRVDHVTFADANLGMFVERDNNIIDYFIKVAHQHGCIKSYSTNWAKNQKAEVVQLVKKLSDNFPGAGFGLMVSVQSMDATVLENIKRKNLDQHRLSEIFELCETNQVPVFTEVILGLPGETVESWKQSLYQIFRNGNHFGVQVYQAQMLENAEMNLLQRKLFGIKSAAIYDYMTPYNDDILESIDVVYATKSMPEQDMLEALAWTTFIETFHMGGITAYIVRLLDAVGICSYDSFYDLFYKRILQDAWFAQQLEITKQLYQTWFATGRLQESVDGVPVTGLNLTNRLQMMLHSESRLPALSEFIETFLTQDIKLDAQLANQLAMFGDHCALQFDRLNQYPIVLNFDYNFVGAIRNQESLHQPSTIRFNTREHKSMSKFRFLENFHFGKKRGFSGTIVEKV